MKVQIGILSLVAIAAASLGVSPASAILSTPSPTPAFSQAPAVTPSPTFASTGAPVLTPTPVASPSQSASGLAPNPSANPTPSSSPIPSTTAPSARPSVTPSVRPSVRPTSGPSVSPRPTPSTKPTQKPTSAPTPTPTVWAPDPKVLEALLIAKEAELRYQIALLTIEQFESTPKYDAAAHWYAENWTEKPSTKQRWAISDNKSIFNRTSREIRNLEADLQRLKLKPSYTEAELSRAVNDAKSIRNRNDWKLTSSYDENRRKLNSAKSDWSWAKSDARRYKPKKDAVVKEPTPPQVALFLEREVNYRQSIDDQLKLVKDLYSKVKRVF